MYTSVCEAESQELCVNVPLPVGVEKTCIGKRFEQWLQLQQVHVRLHQEVSILHIYKQSKGQIVVFC